MTTKKGRHGVRQGIVFHCFFWGIECFPWKWWNGTPNKPSQSSPSLSRAPSHVCLSGHLLREKTLTILWNKSTGYYNCVLSILNLDPSSQPLNPLTAFHFGHWAIFLQVTQTVQFNILIWIMPRMLVVPKLVLPSPCPVGLTSKFVPIQTARTPVLLNSWH